MPMFNAAYSNIREEIFYNKGWNANGPNTECNFYKHITEYSQVSLAEGEVVKTFDHEKNRRIIIIGTHWGNVVIFERYGNAPGGLYAATFPERFPKSFLQLLDVKTEVKDKEPIILSDKNIEVIVGLNPNSYNIGKVISSIIQSV